MVDIPEPLLLQLVEAVHQLSPTSCRVSPNVLRKATPDDIDRAVATLVRQAAVSLAGAVLLTGERNRHLEPAG